VTISSLLTASHDISIQGVDWRSGRRAIGRLANASAVTLIPSVDEEGGEEGVGSGNRSQSQSGQGKKLHGCQGYVCMKTTGVSMFDVFAVGFCCE
jgi:hypothetical protein